MRSRSGCRARAHDRDRGAARVASGIVTGCLLAVARAAGETAPLLFTRSATAYGLNRLFTSANSALPLQIFRDATSAYVAASDRAWARALVLIMICLLLTIAARIVATRGPSLSDQR